MIFPSKHQEILENGLADRRKGALDVDIISSSTGTPIRFQTQSI